ncbi:apolipoprotein N-acyltransferase [Shimia sp. R11_0]|nr:apolipoprotein N-acyltransferase [Shimia sp. R11_0]
MAESAAPRRRWAVPWTLLMRAFPLGFLAGLGHPPFDLWFVSLLSFAAVFVLLAQTPQWRRALALGMAFGSGYFAMSLHWIVEPFFVDPLRHGWMAPFAIVFISVGLSLFWGAGFALARWLGPRGRAVALTLTGAEILRAYVLTGFPWAMPSYVLLDRLAGQGASFVGPHGMNLAFFLVAVALAAGFKRKRGWPLAGAAAALVFALGWPLPKADAPAVSEPRPVVRLIQPNAPQHQKWDPAYSGLFFERMVRYTSEGAVRPDLIVWPETAVPVLLNYAEETLQIIARAAKGTPVVLGINRFEGTRIYNAAILLDGTGQVRARYDKHHLVPFGEYIPLGDLLSQIGITGMASQYGEGFSPGPGPALMDLGDLGKALLLICYEAVFPQDVTGAPERPDFLLHLTNDAWFGNFSGPFQHLAQARMRAVENGLPVLRAANTGVSAVIDPQGRVLASLALNTEGALDVTLPQAGAPTFYSQTGDLPLALGLIGLLLTVAWRRRRRNALTPD